ncbi:DUF3908 family protein [Paenibacillus elgii]
MEYNTFKSFAYSESFRGRNDYADISTSIDRYIGEREVRLFYPQNLFTEQKPLIAFVFREKDVWVFKSIDFSIEIAVYKYETIASLMLKQPTSNSSFNTLRIGFSSGEVFTFNGRDDTNNHHCHKFNEVITLIFEHVSKNWN